MTPPTAAATPLTNLQPDSPNFSTGTFFGVGGGGVSALDEDVPVPAASCRSADAAHASLKAPRLPSSWNGASLKAILYVSVRVTPAASVITSPYVRVSPNVISLYRDETTGD